GYELDRVIVERGVRNWTSLGFSSIYYILDKLEARGLIEPVGPRRAGKSRAPFRLAPRGVDALRTGSLEAIAELTPVHARVLIGMANSPGLPSEEIRKMLAQRATNLDLQLADLRAARSAQQPLPRTALAIFDYSEALLLADAQWTARLIHATQQETIMDKYDIKTAHKRLFSPSAKKFCLVDVPDLQYISIDGRGDPNTSPEYADAVESLYAVAYTVKFASKSLGRDFTVGPLEGLWRSTDMTSFTRRDKTAWDWTMLISQPVWITPDMIADAREQAARKKQLRGLGGISLRTLTEGRSVQILHIGSYDDEAPALHRLHDEYLPENGLTFNGDHHEIYLSDARRTAPAKRKTILRQPVKALAPEARPAAVLN
ncbi:MAG: GyrI-like domain-containing protein, partial [Actinomycetota bacterium]|nr:GyrI-like domain-containing protein [Actinomycetota bacterium]